MAATTQTRTMSDIRLTGSEIAMVKEVCQEANVNITGSARVDFLFYVDNKQFVNYNIFGGENKERVMNALRKAANNFKSGK